MKKNINRVIVVVCRPAGKSHEYLLLRKRKGGYWQPVAANLNALDRTVRRPL